MKIKSKQCVRLDNGMFFKAEDKLIPIVGGLMCNFIYLEVGDYIGDLQYKITKVANTPQELIEEKDIVEILYSGNRSYYKLEVIKITDTTFVTSHLTISKSQLHDYLYDENCKKLPMIKSIRTPQGKNFICQWEAE